ATRPPSISPFEMPDPTQPSVSRFPHESPTSHPELLPTARSTSMSSQAGNPLNLPMQEPLPLKTSQTSLQYQSVATGENLIDPAPLAPPRPRLIPVPSPRPGRLRRSSGLVRRLLGLAGGIALLGGFAYFGSAFRWLGSRSDDGPLLSEVRRAKLSITVTERGNLESCI